MAEFQENVKVCLGEYDKAREWFWSQRRKDRRREKGGVRVHAYSLVEGLRREKERPDRCLQVVRDEEEVVKQREDRCWLGEGAKVSFRDAGDETRAIVVKGGATAQRQALGEVARV